MTTMQTIIAVSALVWALGSVYTWNSFKDSMHAKLYGKGYILNVTLTWPFRLLIMIVGSLWIVLYYASLFFAACCVTGWENLAVKLGLKDPPPQWPVWDWEKEASGK